MGRWQGIVSSRLGFLTSSPPQTPSSIDACSCYSTSRDAFASSRFVNHQLDFRRMVLVVEFKLHSMGFLYNKIVELGFVPIAVTRTRGAALLEALSSLQEHHGLYNQYTCLDQASS